MNLFYSANVSDGPVSWKAIRQNSGVLFPHCGKVNMGNGRGKMGEGGKKWGGGAGSMEEGTTMKRRSTK